MLYICYKKKYIYKGWLRCEVISKTGENWMKMF